MNDCIYHYFYIQSLSLLLKMAKLLSRKSKFIATYPSTWNDNLTDDMVVSFIKDFIKDKGLCFCVICKELPDETVNREHYHIFFDFLEPINCSNKRMDIPLKEPVVAFYKEEHLIKYINYMENKENIETIQNELNADYWSVMNTAHPNIQIKKGYGSLFDMLSYVIKDGNILWSTGNLDDQMSKYKDKKVKNVKKEIVCNKNIISREEMNFITWLRDLILKDNVTISEVYGLIRKSEHYMIFTAKYLNYKSFINDFFKTKPIVKPKPYWGVFYLPKKLYDYCIYLDKFVEDWHNGNVTEKRPKPLFLSGKAKSGKTSLISSIGDFCYWCNTWNYDSYEAKTAFNLMDDYDGNIDYKGNSINNGFIYLKPWFGGQDVISISGKYKSSKIVSNGRPLVFISNYEFEERFPEYKDRKYILDCGATVVNLGERNLIDPKQDWIEGHNDYVEFDTRNTWWYKNKVMVNDPIVINDEPESERTCDESDNESIVIINDDGRPKRQIQTSLLSTGTRNKKTKISYITD